MTPQQALNARREAAQHIDSYSAYVDEMAEIDRLQSQLTPRVIVAAEPKPQNPRHIPHGMTVQQHLAAQCAAKLAAGVDSRGRPMTDEHKHFLALMTEV